MPQPSAPAAVPSAAREPARGGVAPERSRGEERGEDKRGDRHRAPGPREAATAQVDGEEDTGSEPEGEAGEHGHREVGGALR